MVTSLFDLPPHDRLRRLRELALEARESAAHESMLQHRETFLKIAEHWERMASELDAAIPKKTNT